MDNSAQRVATVMEKMLFLDEGSISASTGISGDFTIDITEPESLSVDQLRGLERLGEDFGAGKPGIIPQSNETAGMIQFRGQVSDLKAQVAEASLSRALETVAPVKTAAAQTAKATGGSAFRRDK